VNTAGLLVLVVLLAANAAGAAGATVEVQNPSFEELAPDGMPLHWQGSSEVYSASPVAHEGSHSLHWSNSDPERYLTCVQSIHLRPGRRYRLSAWIKTEEVAGSGGGATMCLQWSQGGRYLGGFYPSGLKGTQDWTHWEAVSPRTPLQFDHAEVLCYVREGMTGQAWWDQVEITEVPDTPLRVALLEPNYRGWLYGGWPPALRLHITLDLAAVQRRPEEVLLRLRLLDAESLPLLEQEFPVANEQTELSCPYPKLTPGEYVLQVFLVSRSDGQVLGQYTSTLRQWPGEEPTAHCWVDRYQRLIVDGQPFFPLGAYEYWPSPEDLDLVAEGGFNCIQSYTTSWGRSVEQIQGLLDAAQQRGLKLIFGVQDIYDGSPNLPQAKYPEWVGAEAILRGLVTKFRDHPNLLAWYLNDERFGDEWRARLLANQQLVSRLDPNHPTWTVLGTCDEARDLLDTYDVIGGDPYPIPVRSACLAGEYTATLQEQVFGARPIWMVPQMMNWNVYHVARNQPRTGRPPTYEEMRCMAFQCLCQGARGLIFYNFEDLQRDPDATFEQRWADVKPLIQELRALCPILLSVEPTPELHVEGPHVLWLAKTQDAQTYIFLVNDREEATRAEVTLPAGTRARLQGETSPLPTDFSGRLHIDLPPLAVRVLMLGSAE